MAQVPPFVCDLSEEDQKEFWKYMVGNFVMDKIDPFRTIVSKATEVKKELKSKFKAIKLKHGLENMNSFQILLLANSGKSPFDDEEYKQLIEYKNKAGPLYIFSETLHKDTFEPDDRIKFTDHCNEFGSVTVNYSHFKRWYPDEELCYGRN